MHVSTAGYRSKRKSPNVTVKIPASRSDQVSVLDSEELVEWDLRLTATCAEDPQRILRLLTGAVLTCGGWVPFPQHARLRYGGDELRIRPCRQPRSLQRAHLAPASS